jgi:hypothetical protein
MKLCYVYSRYARCPQDGKQHAFWRQIEMFATLFDQVSVLGLARTLEALQGDMPKLPASVSVTEALHTGSYALQFGFAAAGFKTGLTGLVFPPLRSWLKKCASHDSLFFLEGAPLLGLTPRIESRRLFYGEVDSYSRRARRLFRGKMTSPFKERLSVGIATLIERESFKRAHRAHVYSEQDARFLRKVHKLPAGKVVGIPMQSPVVISKHETLSVDAGDLKVLIWADTSYAYLESAVRELLAECLKLGVSRAGISFLVGKNASLIRDVESAGFKVFQRVHSPEETLLKYHVVVVPDLVGTGIKNRTIHGMALGRCVIGTKVAWQGIQYDNQLSGICVESLEHLVSVLRCLPVEKAIMIGQAAKAAVEYELRPSILRKRWAQFFQSSATAL